MNLNVYLKLIATTLIINCNNHNSCSLVTALNQKLTSIHRSKSSYESKLIRNYASQSNNLRGVCNSSEFFVGYFDSVSSNILVADTDSNQDGLKKKYLLYDVNIGEGFNLRRDVYIRMAKLVKLLNK